MTRTVERGQPDTTEAPPSVAVRLTFWCVVGVAAVVLVAVTRHMWFGGDEWFIITDRGITRGPGHDGILEPFNEHWSTLPILAYRALYATVGLHSYWPYIALTLLAHLAIVVLLWYVMLRAQIDAWVATGACAVFAVLGTGSENLLNAWQAQLIAPIALGLGALLLVPWSGTRFTGRDAGAAALLTAAVMCSGVALPVLGAVGIVAVVQRGWRVALGTLVVPAAVYLAWYARYGSEARVADPTAGEMPRFVWDGLTGALGDVARHEVLGVLVVVAVVAWVAWKLGRRPFDRRLVVPGALALAGVAFLASTGWRRGGLPGADPAISRYAYVTVAFVLPLVAMASQTLFRGSAARRLALGVVTIALVVAQVRVLDHAAEVAEPGKRSDRGAMLATAALVRAGRGPFLYERPLHPFEPQVTVDEIAEMDRDGKLPSLDGATRRDRLTALARLELALRPEAVVTPADGTAVELGPARGIQVRPSSGTGCIELRADADNELVLRPSGSAALRVRGDGLVRMWLRDEERRVDGEAVGAALEPDRDLVLSIAGIEGAVVLSLPTGTGTVLCDVG